MHTLRVERCHP